MIHPVIIQKIRVLLVEDDDVDREAVERAMRKPDTPYSLETAATESDARDALKREDFDVILLDYDLGISTGLDLLPFTGDTPVIFVTGSGTEAVAVEAMRKGARDYLIKDPERNYLTVLPLTISTVLKQEQSQRELKQLRHLLGNIVDSMPSMLVSVDHDIRVTRWNRETVKTTGVTSPEANGRFLREVFPQLAGQEDNIRDAIRRRESLKDEIVTQSTENRRLLWDVTIYPLGDDKIEGAVVRVDDVTEKIRLETMMLHSEKMHSVGALAAGMAHELNNPLAGILHNTQVIRSRISGGLPKNEHIAKECGISIRDIENYMERRGIFPMIEAVMGSGRSAARIVDNLLSFSRKSEGPYPPQDLRKLLDAAVDLAGSDYDMKKKYNFQRIRIIREYHPNMPIVSCEPGKIQQVFFNILKNGAQAMARGNTEKPRFTLRVTVTGSAALVRIEDNGPGMDEETRKRIFEPFFTTGEVGEGTGLGLSVAYFIIAHHHRGTMNVESEPGKGAVFSVRLPLEGRLHTKRGEP